jgi:IS30 family transposase
MSRPSAAQAQERRIQVFRMNMRGLNNTSIARELGVSRQTIIADVKWNKEHFTEMAAHADRNEEVGQAIARLEEMEKEAMYHFSEATGDHFKNQYLMTAIAACEKRIKLMMDSGIIQRATIDVNLNIDYSKLTNEELLAKRTEYMSRLRVLGVPSASDN